ncbi:hypothetical protein N7528_001770 [Penicillium herquei]|nr:hypothetical protein N7528_001770 [Penicillium herquei]
MIDNLPLLHAIDTVPEKILREVFKSICTELPEARDQAAKQLLVENTTSENDEESDSNIDSEKPSTSKTNASKPKMVVPRYAVCQNCEKDFETDKNSSTACRYHPRRSEPTDELYGDTYGEERYGIDSEDMRQEYPDYFEFPCCGATLEDNSHGCEVGLHVDASAQRDKTAKRVRFH